MWVCARVAPLPLLFRLEGDTEAARLRSTRLALVRGVAVADVVVAVVLPGLLFQLPLLLPPRFGALFLLLHHLLQLRALALRDTKLARPRSAVTEKLHLQDVQLGLQPPVLCLEQLCFGFRSVPFRLLGLQLQERPALVLENVVVPGLRAEACVGRLGRLTVMLVLFFRLCAPLCLRLGLRLRLDLRLCLCALR